MSAFLRQIYHKYLPLKIGRPSRILPQLAAADPDDFAVCAVMVSGRAHTAGECEKNFTLQSISKPFVYGMALQDHGEAFVRERVGVEPTGDAFNSMIQHDQVSEGRFNPMVNVGAVTTTSLIKGETPTARIGRLQRMFSRYVGHPVGFDAEVLNSRRRLDNQNRAIGYLMMSEGHLSADVEATVELYAHQCSVSVTCRDLAFMAATLANGGIHPLTGVRAVSSQYVCHLLSIMFSSGLYDYSGQWAYRVGIPAKSGLAGAILAVVPGQMGLAAYSPLLGRRHKTVRGVRALEEISNTYRCHSFCRPQRGLCSTISRSSTDVADIEPVFQAIHAQYRGVDHGEIYVSEPGLRYVDRRQFAICAVTTEGQSVAAGDADADFLIQSVSKLMTYGLALEDHGRDEVLKRVGVEPTGDAYNAVIKVQTASKRPHNPMVNAGGLAVASLIKGKGPAQRLNRVLAAYQRYTGRPAHLDTAAFLSERAGNDRNWAIAYLLRNFGMIEGDIGQAMDLYLQQCSVIVNSRDLAVMGATLANGGINPLTGRRALKGEYARDLLTVMHTCGMYDFAGEWACKVGIPAKSGVSGCIVGVVPGRMGIAVYSPPLDRRGNSLRGIKVFEELSRRLHLHIFQL
ncbi:MAG: glutaminase A [Desulfatitalea sp.]|nr:glutaminase A [Desulfatitalea sp.]